VLRFLETNEIQPLGDEVQEIDVRVLASTNRDLSAAIAQKQFRSDLFYRLKVVSIGVDPLRERKEDIPVLLTHYQVQMEKKLGHSLNFDDDVVETLSTYEWPGNVRELAHLVEDLAYRAGDKGRIRLEYLPSYVFAKTPATSKAVDENLIDRANRMLATDLWERLLSGESFWVIVHDRYMDREISRPIMRELIHIGLTSTTGNYRALMQTWGMDASEPNYKRFLNFLRKHRCRLDFAEYRKPKKSQPND
jgi:DNA-binding NtrC family response regulator